MVSFYSSWEKILPGALQGSILGPLKFKIFMCGMLLILKVTSFTAHVDDNTQYVVRENTTNLIKTLEDIAENLTKWFSDNQMKLKPITIKIENLCINDSLCEKLSCVNSRISYNSRIILKKFVRRH